MAYSELIKDYERVRDYMREFYIYGFKSREEYDSKSARSYDNERRRIESWLGEYMSFRQDAGGKQVFLSVDSRRIDHNPLYQSFKAKSFTDKDITLHFYLLDIFADGGAYTTKEVVERMDKDYLSHFDSTFSVDMSTVRKKLKEYETIGLLKSGKRGRETCYQRPEEQVRLDAWTDAVSFYAEAAPLGVIGSFLLDRLGNPDQPFGFKHHYILHAMDSQILEELLCAMGQHLRVKLTVKRRNSSKTRERWVYPLKLYVSSQTGRQYLLFYEYSSCSFAFCRVDRIVETETGGEDAAYPDYEEWYRENAGHFWGVSANGSRATEHLEMTVHAEENESFIVRRLEREKRHGTVERLDEHTYRFTADVFDAYEMLPWLRTFIGRIVSLKCSNPAVVQTFYEDMEQMTAMYGGVRDGVQ